MSERYNPEFSTESEAQEIWNIVDEAVQEGYKKEAKETGDDPDEMYYSPRCEGVSRSAVEHLVSLGFSAEIAEYSGWDILNHDFILLDVEGERWIVDATWQQFLEERDAQLPKILKAKLSDMDAVLEKSGVPQKWRHVWSAGLQQERDRKEIKQ